MGKYLFTSESVSEGHPDKLCDQVSDAILDACLAQDPQSRVGCETFSTTGVVLVGGEITTKAAIDIQALVRSTVAEIGYTDPAFGIDANSMSVMNLIHTQSPDISMGVTEGDGLFKAAGAGDQGMMFGFACDETEEFMPAPLMFSHKILKYAADLRKAGEIAWMRPDSKSQVTIQYEDFKPKRIDTIVVSHQHSPEVTREEIEHDIINRVINPSIGSCGLIDEKTRFLINPTGRFVIGGPHGDAGLTGRKIIVDTYGGMGRHGGGAFSGKDSTKVDRSAAYMARYIAKNIVAAGLASRCEIELAYAIGVADPISIMANTFETGKIPEDRIVELILKVFDLTPSGINVALDLRKPIYKPTAAYGHFGRSEFSWEEIDKVKELQRLV